MEDLVVFVNRADLPAVTQAAVAHVQFRRSIPSLTATGASAGAWST
ncbi:MAG: hypothetical protein U0V56_03545 [Actinomycetota bacterium]